MPHHTAADKPSSTPPPSGVSLTVDPTALAPLVRAIVGEVLQQLDADAAKVDAGGGGKLAYSEEEAARLLGLEPHVLRDERLRGRIGASQIVGRRVRYTREDLTAYLAARRVSVPPKP